MLLANKTALVTGASRGIGRAVALELAKAGAKIAVNFAGNRKAAEEVAGLIEAAGGQALLVQADVGDAAAVDAMVKAEHFLPNEQSYFCTNCQFQTACKSWHNNRNKLISVAA